MFSFNIVLLNQISSDAQRSSVWRSVKKVSAERPDFAERERARASDPRALSASAERQVIVNIIFSIRNTVKFFFSL
jgi:hypothetical protein